MVVCVWECVCYSFCLTPSVSSLLLQILVIWSRSISGVSSPKEQGLFSLCRTFPFFPRVMHSPLMLATSATFKKKKGNRNAPHSNCPTATSAVTRGPRGSWILSSPLSCCCRLTLDLTHSIPAINYYVGFKGNRETGPFECTKGNKEKNWSPETRFERFGVSSGRKSALLYTVYASLTCLGPSVEFRFGVALPDADSGSIFLPVLVQVIFAQTQHQNAG